MDFFRFRMLALFLLLLCGINAQTRRQKEYSVLSESDMSKLLKAHSYIAQGNEILFADFVYPKDSLFGQTPHYITLSENLYAGKRVSRLLFETKDYYRTGFESMTAVYKRYINQYLRDTNNLYYAQINALRDSVDKYAADAKEGRNRSQVSAQLRKGGAQIHASNIQYQQAVLFCIQALDLIEKESGLKVQGKEAGIIQDTIGSGVEHQVPKPVRVGEVRLTPNLVTEKIASDSSEPPEVKQVIVVEKEEERAASIEKVSEKPVELYYTVQIMADKAPVSEARIKQVYSGKYPIVENKRDGWFRYSFGKFGTFSEAKEAFVQSHTKGYIVAYKGNDRISLGEAKAWLTQ